MDLAVGHLAKKGYRKVGMLHGPLEVTFREGNKKITSSFIDTRLKKEGFLKAIKARKLLTRPAWIRSADANNEPEGYRIMKKWLREKTMPEAIVCGNDDLAFGVMKALKETGKKVPSDLAVIGFDDNDGARSATPPLTTIRQPLVQMAQDAIDILIQRIETPGLKPVARQYAPQLVVRKTT